MTWLQKYQALHGVYSMLCFSTSYIGWGPVTEIMPSSVGYVIAITVE